MPLVILGASVRAFAESARRAGRAVYAADLFCDLDLQAISTEAVAVTNESADDGGGYPWSLRTAAASFPPSAVWCYTGAIENHPDLVDAVAATRPLAGNPGTVLRQLRDPAQVADAAFAGGLAFPETHLSPSGVPIDGTFLIKPIAGAGGRGIQRWTSEAASDHGHRHAGDRRPLNVWQRFEAGLSLSAAYCLSQGKATLLGLTRQLIGEPWCHASRFAWCGAVTLWPSDASPDYDRLAAQLQRFGDVLADRFHAVGLVGVDLMADESGRLTVLEVNPRPTASMELFERSGVCSIAASHLSACGFPASARQQQPAGPTEPATIWAKAVLFAEQATPIAKPLIDALILEASAWTDADGGWPALADIPRPRQNLAARGPAVTLYASGRTADEAIAALRGRVARIDALLTAARAPTADGG
jgi:predicted ATP-grasp superfamily ATP-dependent carboligase